MFSMINDGCVDLNWNGIIWSYKNLNLMTSKSMGKSFHKLNGSIVENPFIEIGVQLVSFI